MKNVSKKGWLVASQFSLLLFILWQLPSSFSTESKVCISCSTPSVTITGQSSNSVSFSWNAVSGASNYKIRCRRQEDGYTGPELTTGNTSINFANLPPGTYTFSFATVCGSEVSEFIVFDDVIMG